MIKHSLYIAFLLIVVGCTQNKKSSSTDSTSTIGQQQENNNHILSKDTLAYEIRTFNKNLPDCKKDTCDVYVKASYPFFEDKRVNKFVLTILTPVPYGDKIAASLDIAADSFINEYTSYKKDYPESPAGYEWEQTISVSQQVPHILAFTQINYAYTGGAHGMESTIYHNITSNTRKKITLDDVLIKNYKNKLTNIAEKIFRKDENLSANEDLTSGYFFEDGKFYLTDNFLITKEGLQFLYNPYEIKAYAYGTTTLIIPYSAIKTLLKSDGILAQNI